ncbi:MAG: hypothetical protein IJ880_05335 [Bacilli bacterium]|nr:hypothetical protein [Bacilli bacterium]
MEQVIDFIFFVIIFFPFFICFYLIVQDITNKKDCKNKKSNEINIELFEKRIKILEENIQHLSDISNNTQFTLNLLVKKLGLKVKENGRIND